MNVSELISALDLETLVVADETRQIEGVYCGDLLSWVMGKLSYGSAWVTIMNNVNVVAVATLADASCIILSENSEVGEDVISKAQMSGVNVLRTPKSSFEICCMLGAVLNG